MKHFDWYSITYRAFGILNFLVALMGGIFLAPSVWAIRLHAIGDTPDAPHFLPAFWTMALLNVCFLGLLVFGGIRLLQLRDVGVTICNFVFLAEIFYFLIVGLLWGHASREFAMSVAGATGVGNMGISPQLMSGYPFMALGFLNLVRWRRNKRRTAPAI